MPTKIVDLSARSEVIRDEPFHVHFWECSPIEFMEYLKAPRKFLKKIIPTDCRIETTIENHDWLGEHAAEIIICNVGGGNIARSVYRVVSYGHDRTSIGKYKKTLLHGVDEQQKG